MSNRIAWMTGVALLAVLLVGWPGLGQDAGEQPEADGTRTAEDSQPADTDAGSPSAEDVLEEMERARDASWPAERGRGAGVERPEAISPESPLAGVAPGEVDRQLKREGAFVVRRRGRMVPAEGGAARWMFTFESDKDGMEDPPMYLMPCRLLERMEQVSKDSDEPVSFILSGQVFVYHDANYLLPTVMRLAPQRGNLGG